MCVFLKFHLSANLSPSVTFDYFTRITLEVHSIFIYIYFFQNNISLQGKTNDIAPYINNKQVRGSVIHLVQKSELQTAMENNKTLLEPSVQLASQPYEITSSNIKYIVDNLKPVCFISKNSDEGNNALVSGMSFHTSLRMKVGLVIYACFKVSKCSEFDIHFKAHLKYVTQQLLT